MANCRITYFQLSPDVSQEIDTLLSKIMGEADSVEMLPFLDTAAVIAHELPKDIRSLLYKFKLHQSADAVCIRGHQIDDAIIGPTPLSHRPPGQVEYANRYEVLHLLYASLLGEPFGWMTIQNGYIINNIVPIPEHRDQLSSTGSSKLFDLHTEDAFHPNAGDYLGLMCLRNPDSVGTILSRPSGIELSEAAFLTLFEPRYIVGANIAQEVPGITQPSPVLFGNPKFPYIRVNLNSTHAVEGDDDAAQALEELKALLRKNSEQVSFQAGDCWYIDNLHVVHGRGPYNPRFDGTDRWLKRLYITRSHLKNML
jgi:hypothetical protein